MSIDNVPVIARHLDDIDLQGWRERIDEVRDSIKRAAHGEPSIGNDGSFCGWKTPRRDLTVLVEPAKGISIISERQAMRAGFTLRIAQCTAVKGLNPSDRSSVVEILDVLDRALEGAIADEGDEDVPSETWGVLSKRLHELADDLLSMVFHTYEESGNRDGIDMLSEYPLTLQTGVPWGSPRLLIHVDGEDMDLLGAGGTAMVATMMKPVSMVSSPKHRTLLLGPATIERGPWRDPGPVARMRGIARFSQSR